MLPKMLIKKLLLKRKERRKERRFMVRVSSSNVPELSRQFYNLGVDNRKFYTEKNDEEANAAIMKTNSLSDVEKREEVFTKNRVVLNHQIRLLNFIQ
jgi:hypothetical protein